MSREDRYRAVFRAHYADVLAFVRRRYPGDAEAVVAETFTTLWRRFDQAPVAAEDVRAWLFTTARNTLLNARRADRRRDALGVRVTETLPDDVPWEPDRTAERLDLARAWNALPEDAQEALALSLFDGLASAQAADVLGIRAEAYRARLSRARRALANLMEVSR
ncbi:MAG: sigma-70 family RNA polymerase sigma factor [Propionibacteriaceae bacterium]|nr:sigma-70 family RNA polymerase sigma factor [Propionibacteriaceae bacterium]